MDMFWTFLGGVGDVVWHPWVLYVVLAAGLLFTIWSGFGQYRALTHGTQVIRGKYDDKDDPGAINHFQALSAALSATVGLGNIGGVALAIAIGGPGAVLWMWLVGILGMALKMTEVTLSMLDRNTDDPENPHGGPMWVAQRGFERWGLKPVGSIIGGIFVITLLASTVTGGNMFQAWSVADVTKKDFAIPEIVTGIILAVVVGIVIIGGVKRIGAVAGRLVPVMCAIYFLAAMFVVVVNYQQIPDMFALIFRHAFGDAPASGAFMGATGGVAGFAFAMGMQRALFSSEAGQGSSPIAHAAAKTDEPVREGVVAGLEPFIDTIVVCTLTSLVILSTGAWDRSAEAVFEEGAVSIVQADEPGDWTIDNGALPPRTDAARRVEGRWSEENPIEIFMLVDVGESDEDTGTNRRRIAGTAQYNSDIDEHRVEWASIESETRPTLVNTGIYVQYTSASLTSHAFNREVPGLGKYLVVLAAWLFAISTMISWSYYGEQGIIFLFGEGAVMPYKVVYCLLIVVASSGLITTANELNLVTTFGTGVMLWANIPIMLIFGSVAMREFHRYNKRLKAGEFKSEEHKPPRVTDVVEGRDVE